MNENNLLIKNIISDYFKTELEAIKSVNYDKDTIAATTIKEYQNVHCDFLSKWYKKVGANLISYHLDVDIESINYDDDLCTAVISKGTDMVFDISPDIVQKARDDKYKFELVKVGNQWKIKDFKISLFPRG